MSLCKKCVRYVGSWSSVYARLLHVTDHLDMRQSVKKKARYPQANDYFEHSLQLVHWSCFQLLTPGEG